MESPSVTKPLTNMKLKAEPENSSVSTKQALLYVGIVVACFVVVYPRMIHPMVKMVFGFTEPKPKDSEQRFPPQMINRGKPVPGAGMRPPPGARGEHANADAGKGSGGGLMTMVLPLYAGGLFLYLLYAASKAYNKGGSSNLKKKDLHEDTYSLITEKLAGLDLEKIVSGEDIDGASEINKLAEFLRRKHDTDGLNDNWMDDMEEDDDVVDSVEVVEMDSEEQSRPVGAEVKPEVVRAHQRPEAELAKKPRVASAEDDTDELLRKCENHESMTPEEMARLKSRLSEVENRMNKLMSAIQTVQEKPTTVASSALDEGSNGSESEHRCDVHTETQVITSDNLLDVDDCSSSDDDLSDVDRDEVEQIYAELDSSSSGDEAAYLLDSETGAVRRRLPLAHDFDEEAL